MVPEELYVDLKRFFKDMRYEGDALKRLEWIIREKKASKK